MSNSKLPSVPVSCLTRPRPTAATASPATASPADTPSWRVPMPVTLPDITVIGGGRHTTKPPGSNRDPSDLSSFVGPWPLVSHHCIREFSFPRAWAVGHGSGTPGRLVTSQSARHWACVVLVWYVMNRFVTYRSVIYHCVPPPKDMIFFSTVTLWRWTHLLNRKESRSSFFEQKEKAD